VPDNTFKNQKAASYMEFSQAPENHGNVTADSNHQPKKHPIVGQQSVI